MRLCYKKYILVGAIVSLLGAVGFKADTNLSNTTGFSCTSLTGRSVATDGQGRVHTIWTEMSMFNAARLNAGRFGAGRRAADTAYYYRRSLDHGTTWQTAVRLVSAGQASTDPALATDGNNTVHLVWEDERDGGNAEIYFKRSTDGGATWGTDTRLTTTDPASGYPAIAAANGGAYISWLEDRDTIDQISFARSTDNGQNWSAARVLADARRISVQGNPVDPYPTLAASGNTIHVVWNSATDDTTGEIYHLRSTDGGETWQPRIRVTADPEGSLYPAIAASGNLVGLVWGQSNYDSLDPKSAIFFKRSTDGGATWTAKTAISDTSRLAYLPFGPPQVAVSHQRVAVVWAAVDGLGDSLAQINLVTSGDGGQTWSAEIALAPEDVHASFPSVAFDNSDNIHIVWSDDRSGIFSNFEVYYTKRQVTAVAETPASIRLVVTDIAAGPVPFRSAVGISYSLSRPGLVAARVMDAQGRIVRTLFTDNRSAGTHALAWNGSDESGRPLPTGIYLLQLTAGASAASEKIILVR